MKAGWQTNKLASVSEVFTDGDWVESKDQSQEGFRLVQTGNVGLGEFKFKGEKARYISEETFKRLRCTEIHEGDCLVSRLPDPVGRACIVPDTGEKMITAVDCTIIRFHPEKVLPKFFNYFAQSSEYLKAVATQSTGATRLRISRANLGEIAVPTPPLPEQQRIVTILDQAFEGIAVAKANAEKNLRNARELFESELRSVFALGGGSWKRTSLGEIAEVQSGGTPLVSNKSFWGGDIPWYSSGELNKLYTTVPERNITKAGLEGSNAKLFPKDSLLIGMYDTAALKMSILDRDGAFNQAIAGVKPNEQIDLAFVLHAINAVKPSILNLRRGVRQKNLSLTKIKEISLAIPPITEQRRVVAKLDELSTETQRLEAIYKQKLLALDELKKSILHQAFTGQLQ